MNRLDGWVTGGLLECPNLLLAIHLLMIHVLAFGGWQDPSLKLLWVVAFGVFLLWQPFVASAQAIKPGHALMLWLGVSASTIYLGPWLILIWCGVLAAAIGGRVLRAVQAIERIGYLLAFGFLVAITVLGVLPEVSPSVDTAPLSRSMIALWLPVFFPVLAFIPARAQLDRPGAAFDLFYGMLVFLVLAVFVLGALAYMLIGRVGYLEALIKTSWVLAMALLLLAWAWNPRAGFSGIGASISKALLTIGLPLEEWLAQLAEESEREDDPAHFVMAVMNRLHANPWVAGVSWRSDSGEGALGKQASHACWYNTENLSVSLSFRNEPPVAVRWHAEWLLRLVAEFFQIKRQAQELQRLGYLQAVYETGARVTHDVKNLLQSLQTLCYAAGQPGDPARVVALLGKQLPRIAERLSVTLEKLQSPLAKDVTPVKADEWWSIVCQRHTQGWIAWSVGAVGDATIPLTLYDSVLENLLQNVTAKKLREPELSVLVSFDGGALRVCDDGSDITEELALRLFTGPLKSADGLGIGLYQSARLAEESGCCLALTENHPGAVCFTLAPK